MPGAASNPPETGSWLDKIEEAVFGKEVPTNRPAVKTPPRVRATNPPVARTATNAVTCRQT